MKPTSPLPIDASWQSTDVYVESLLTFVSTSELFRNLCGGVHVLDFLTCKPNLYARVLPGDWREWFEEVEVEDVLDLLLREDLQQFRAVTANRSAGEENHATWRGFPVPPASLVEYVNDIRRLSLKRDSTPRKLKPDLGSLPRHISVGMKVKKVHEVTQFAGFVDELSQYLSAASAQRSEGGSNAASGANQTDERQAPVVIDFGCGQNYLGRTLACPPHNKRVIAIEQRHHNVEGARGMDVSAKLMPKQKNMINKKEWKAQWEASRAKSLPVTPAGTETAPNSNAISEAELQDILDRVPLVAKEQIENRPNAMNTSEERTKNIPYTNGNAGTPAKPDYIRDEQGNELTTLNTSPAPGTIQYVEKALSSGDLSDTLAPASPASMVVSIHSCGNLTHHGLRSLVLNPSVKAVALIGCCYNLLTERLGPPTYKLPILRSNHPRLEATSSAFDPHGFPMSKRLEDFTYPIYPATATKTIHHTSELEAAKAKRYYHLNGNVQEIDNTGRGVRLNITARMMAVQAPHNWGPKDSEDFFTRHYYRALLQRILLNLDIVKMSTPAAKADIEVTGGTLSGKDESGSPLIIGSLRKSCFASFEAYVGGAVEKLVRDPVDGASIKEKTKYLFEYDGEMIKRYERVFGYAKKHLSIIWSLMAFSANVVESTILVDRWLWLKEQDEVQDAWIEAVFDYKLSPRNMVVVGIKKPDA